MAFFNVNVSDEQSVEPAIQGVQEKFGDFQICCNYAGIGLPEKTVGREGPHSLDNFKHVINVNIAHLAQYIAENDYTNGECIRMDAGIRMQPR